MSGIVSRPVILSLFLAAVLSILLLTPAHAEESSIGQRLILNVYLDSSGKALVTGYAENVSGLAFLNNSQFRFENESHQLYALTAGLTTKVGDIWTLRFDANGSFDDYRATFYLPSETSLGQINASQGLGYLLSASNESLVADVQGWEVTDPQISIQYQQPLAANSNSQLPLPPGYPGESTALIMLIIAAALLVAGFGFAVFLQRKRRATAASPLGGLSAEPIGAEKKKSPEVGTDAVALAVSIASSQTDMSDHAEPQPPGSSGVEATSASLSPSHHTDSASDDDGVFISQDELQPASANESESNQTSPSGEMPMAEASAVLPESTSSVESSAVQETPDAKKIQPEAGPQQDPTKNDIVVSSEMEAVIETLTARERAVMSTLIAHGGRMTQAEIRYETGTPKSSLTGILISLERRKLVIKKEWGRTNIIELSEWFLSKKERS
ncbi:MAG: hypothetical protein LUQ59_05970 [Methanothrix sp.]|nr:hypothetical protein [Methanothrix sp.]